MNSDEFFKTADSQVIKVQEDTTVTPSPDLDGTVTEPDVKKYMVEGYTIKVDEGKNLVLKNLSMNNPVIQGKGNITLSVDEYSLIDSKLHALTAPS